MENQLSRYGAVSKSLEHLGPQGKVFFLAKSSADWYGDFQNVFPPDSDGYSRVFTTLAAAKAACVASRGDVILALPGYTETLTAAFALSVAGVSLVGIGQGSLRPTITVNAAVDGINMSGANTRLENFAFAAPSTDQATAMVNVSAAGVTLKKIRGIGSGNTNKSFVDCITIASGGDDLRMEDIKIYNTVQAVNSFLSIEAAVARMEIDGFFAFGDVSTAGIIDAATATQINWANVNVGVVGSSKPAATLDSNPTGFIRNSNFAGTSTTLATNAALGTGVRLFDVKVLEETDGSKQGANIPAVDAD